MVFKGIPIDGHIEDFVKALENQGYKKVYDGTSGVVMKGDFTGKNAEIFILYTSKTKTVWKVAAQFDKNSSWYKLKSDYFDYVELYTQKYGKPSEHFEFFVDPYYEGDGYELQALEKEKCFYNTFFKTELGILSVKIASSGTITLSYEDYINSNKEDSEKTSSALDDI